MRWDQIQPENFVDLFTRATRRKNNHNVNDNHPPVESRIPDMLERMIVTERLIIDSWDVRIFMYIKQVADGGW